MFLFFTFVQENLLPESFFGICFNFILSFLVYIEVNEGNILYKTYFKKFHEIS